jgi:pimeloyl-ACP methyl ester carboxylesterase
MSTPSVLPTPDGRSLAWSEYGDPGGSPLLLFHGWPGSRLVGGHFHEAAQRTGIRLICPDRPGSGASAFREGRRILDWPADVAVLVDRLGIERFAVAGKSAGGPYALACCAELPERVRICGLLSSACELGHPWSLEGVRRQNRVLWGLARRTRLGRTIFVRLTEAAVRRGAVATGVDQTLAEALHMEMREGFRGGGGAGGVIEVELLCRPWGVDLGRIEVPVVMWHGVHDDLASPVGAHVLASSIPSSTEVPVDGPDADHFWPERHAEEVLGRLG